MKQTILPLLLLFAGLAQAQQLSFSALENRAGALLGEVVHSGRVDYAALQKNPAELHALVRDIAAFAMPESATKNERLAFYINAYNILVIDGVVSAWPLQSVMDVPGFFRRVKYTVAGEEMTLQQLEDDKIRAPFRDPRIHFVLVCAAASCPEIIPQAYRAASLDRQLAFRTRKSLNDPLHVRYDSAKNEVFVSELFKWYESDFTEHSGSVIAYINTFRRKKIPENASLRYSPYDWSLNAYRPAPSAANPGAGGEELNLQSYTPSRLLLRGELEIKQFNNIYTQTAFYDGNSARVELNSRQTYFTGITNILIGWNGRVNFGLDLFLKAVRLDETGSSPFSVLRFSSGPKARAALASFAPKIKIAPWSRISSLAVQTSVVIPLVSDPEGRNNGRPWLDYDAVQWWTQIFYDRALSAKSLVYLESSWFVRFEDAGTALETPFKALVNYYPSHKWTVYAVSELTPTWGSFSGWSAWYSQFGAGLKYQLTSGVELETLYTFFPAGREKGAGQTFNFGLRYVK